MDHNVLSQYDKFYNFSDLDRRRSVYLQPSPPNVHFPYLAVLKDELQIEKPLCFTVKKGSFWDDLIYGGWPSIYVVSSKFYSALKDVSGVSLDPVLISDRKSRDVNGYFRLSVTGRCGPIKNELSTVVDVVNEHGTFPHRKGAFFDYDTWDGSDFFIPKGTAKIIVTERVREIVLKNKLTNVYLEKLVDQLSIIVPEMPDL